MNLAKSKKTDAQRSREYKKRQRVSWEQSTPGFHRHGEPAIYTSTHLPLRRSTHRKSWWFGFSGVKFNTVVYPDYIRSSFRKADTWTKHWVAYHAKLPETWNYCGGETNPISAAKSSIWVKVRKKAHGFFWWNSHYGWWSDSIYRHQSRWIRLIS